MLCLLRIKNFAVVEEAEVEFGPGLNAITGETGAGKSIILKSIDLLCGKRTKSEIIRAGADKCEIEGLFILPSALIESLTASFDEIEDILAGEDELLVKRVIDTAGRTKVYLNGSLSTAGLLQQLSIYLLQLTAQQQTQSLLQPNKHIALLDSYGTDQALLAQVQEKYTEYARAKSELESFLKEAGNKERYLELLRAECEELTKAGLSENEEEIIAQELSKLEHVETIGISVQEALDIIEGEEHATETKLTRAHTLISRASTLDKDLSDTSSLLESAAVQLSEARICLSDYLTSLDADPARLEELRDRAAEISRLKRKFNKTVTELIAHHKTIEKELNEYDAGNLSEESLQARVDSCRQELSIVEEKLTKARKALAKKLSKNVEAELANVNMKQAKFQVEIAGCESNRLGADAVQFMLAANPGQPFQPLANVASGGELSRMLLVLKTVIQEDDNSATQIFDEIDSGIGGAVAQVVGEKLKQISNSRQVILVTHSPQIAALADIQFVINKEIVNGETHSSVKRLEQKDRVGEIARMLAGKEITKEFENSAKELLKSRISAENSSIEAKYANASTVSRN